MFEEYKDLYKLTSKTVDDHIEFFKTKSSLSEESLFDLWKKLSDQAENFDKRNWFDSWNHKNKNFHAFDSLKFQAKYLIQGFLTDVLEELIRRLVENYSKCVELAKESRKSPQIPNYDFSVLIRDEVKRQIKELANQKSRARKSRK